jgi:hypothetical protein
MNIRKSRDVLSAMVGKYPNMVGKYPNLKIFNLPFEIVYPFDSSKIEFCFNNNIQLKQLNGNTIGYHWYAGHPTSQDYNNKLNDNNYMNYDNLFCNICKNILK